MKKLVYIVFFVSFVVTTACSKIDYQINEAYETAEIQVSLCMQ